jgi:NAD(P) transhydrogenase
VTIEELLWRTNQVVDHEREALAGALRRNGIDVLAGAATFVGPHTLELRRDGERRRIGAERVVIAVGTEPARPACVDFDDRTVLDADSIARLARIPRSLTVVGGGVVGVELASTAATLGVAVTVIERRPRLLELVDDEIVEALLYHLRGVGVEIRLGSSALAVERSADGAVTLLDDGTGLASEAVLWATARRGATGGLGLASARLEADERGLIAVGDDLRTAQPHVFAAGDVTGRAGRVATSLEQGRLAALTAFGERAPMGGPVPFGIYTVPEIAFVGSGERELARAGVPYVAGVARAREVAEAEISGHRSGLLKLLVDAETGRVLGAHIFGHSAAELVHVGRVAIAGGLTVDELADAGYNVPSLTEAYRIAALDASARLAGARPARISRAA